MNKKILSLGKQRGLSQCANELGVFNILALDHRQAVKKVFAASSDSYTQAVDFKRAVVKSLAPVSTAILLDPSIGAGPCLADLSLPGRCGLIVTVEASGYAGPAHARISRLPQDWSADRIKRLGASAVKLLVYYHPRSQTAPMMQELVAQVSADCQRLDVPLFLEILTYSPEPEKPKLSPKSRIDAVIGAAADLTPLGGDILKTEFPVDVNASPDPGRWEGACRQLTEASTIPWVLLSAGVDYPVFAQQAEIACCAGASGILAGRAIWKEALEFPEQERLTFLESTGRARMQSLDAICGRYARPYTESCGTQPLTEDWYADYAGL